MKQLLRRPARALNKGCANVRRKLNQLSDDECRTFQVAVNIRLLNQSLLRAQYVAISAIDPVFEGEGAGPAQALRIMVEGPSQNLRYFERLLRKARLSMA
ncbi:MAG: hypothetical protein IPK79_09630 [Vampirovibrionales bacterium]|nr:hypothetical protein [Vampirovibrionales bacterium]